MTAIKFAFSFALMQNLPVGREKKIKPAPFFGGQPNRSTFIHVPVIGFGVNDPLRGLSGLRSYPYAEGVFVPG